MSAKVTLTITAGDLQGQEYIFAERTTCIIGRAQDCQIKIPDDEQHRSISRYHCLLDINPPSIRVRDFGSKNGTYLNGDKIGQRPKGQTPEEAAQMNFPEHDLKAGDIIKVGKVIFQVSIDIPTEAIGGIAPTLKITPETQGGIPPTIPSRKPNLWERLQNLLGRAQARENSEELIAIRGYSIIRKLGEGANGAVYLAQREHRGEQVALKVMLPAVLAAQENIDKFLREARNTKALNHPHVVQLKEAGYSEDTFFFTLEYCEGGSLAEFISRRGGKLDLETAIPIIKQVLEGLEYAHNAYLPEVKLADSRVNTGRGLVHRDLKPSNILLTNINSLPIAKIADYGLSKAFDLAGLSGLTATGTKAGTPCFMPRQQVIDFKYALPEVDLWAAAAVLYYMLAGTYPRNFDAKPEPWLVILQTNAVPILERNPSLPKDLAEVIDLALIDNPQIHFKTAAEFLQALSQVI